MVFKSPKVEAPEEGPAPPSPTDVAIRRQAEAARRRRVRGGRASTILTGAGRSPSAASPNPSVSSATLRSRNGGLGALGGGFASIGSGVNF